MGKYIIGVIVIVALLLGLGYYFSLKNNGGMPAQTQNNQPPPQAQMSTYATSTYTIEYPPSYSVDPNYAYQGVPKKPIPGVKFTIPGSMATGTNLSDDSGVSVEQLPRAKTCSGDIFLYQTVKPVTMTIGSSTYSVATSTDAGAGNRYKERVFAIKGSNPCTAVRYFVHFGAIENYPTGAVQQFDENALLADFDKIRDSLTLTSPQTP